MALTAFRAALYDALIVGMTADWYRAVLGRLPPGCRLLDIGIGTAGALLVHADRLRVDGLRVTGVDIDADYVERGRRAVLRLGLQERVEIRCESVYDHRGGPYDAAYFSGSFMLLPDPAGALRHVAGLLVPAAPVFFTQTFERRRSRLLEILKPLLRRVTTIDFGRVTYEDAFRRSLAAAGFGIEEIVPLHEGRRRSAVLAVARAGPTAEGAQLPPPRGSC